MQQAAHGRPGGRHRRRRRARPVDRRDPGHGQHADLRPDPAVQPRPGRHPRLRASQLDRRPRPRPTRRSASATRPARSSRSSCPPPRWPPATTPRTRRSRRPTCCTLPGTSTTLENFDGESCNGGADQPLIDALTISCNTAFAQLGIDLGEDKVRDMAEAFGIDERGLRDAAAGRAAASSGDIDERRRARHQLHRPAGRPADADAGRHDRRRRRQRRHPDEALPRRPGPGARPHRHRPDRPGGAGPAGLHRGRRASSPR